MCFLPMLPWFGPLPVLVARLYQSHDLLSSFDQPPEPSDQPAWFADPGSAELREHLSNYLSDYRTGLGRGRFNNARPHHFLMYVLHKVRAQGHHSLTYLAQRKIESIFEEHVQSLLTDDAVRIEREDLLVTPRGADGFA